MDDKEKKQKRSRSLSITLLIAFLGLGAIVLFANNGLNLYFNFQKEQSIIGANQDRSVEDAANTVKDFIDEKFRILEQAAYINDLAALPDRRALVLGKLVGRDPSFRQLLLVDIKGQQLQKVSRLSDSVPIHLTGADMKNLLSAISDNKRYISPVYFDQTTKEPIVVIAIPAKNVFGDVQAAFIAEVNLKFIWDLVSSIKIGDKGVAYVVDKQGNLIAFRDTSRVLKRENLSNFKEVKDFTEGIKENNTKIIDISNGIQGTLVISSYASLGIPDWAVVVEIPVFEAYQSLIQEVELSVFIMLLSIIFGVVTTVYISKKVTKPIAKLTEVVRKIAAGDLDAQIEVKSTDEIGMLASSFNQMTGELRGYQQGLEQKVLERTQELEKAKQTAEESLKEVEELNSLMVGRELKMIELKKEITRLKGELAKHV